MVGIHHSRIMLIAALLLGMGSITSAQAARCLFVSSYHQGYAWADGIEAGVRDVLKGRCELQQLNMDTKRHKNEAYKIAKGLEVKNYIEEWRPDVVIVADDNASKYVVVPYFKESAIPFVFCGINLTVAEYGYPFRNVTGMIEVSPLHEMYEMIRQIVPTARLGFYIGADTETEQKSYVRFQEVAQRYDLKLFKRLANSQAEWDRAYLEAQKSDFVILGTDSGIADWNETHAHQLVSRHGVKLSLTNYDWMMRYAALGMTKIAREHGEWAAKSALEILAGTPPVKIQIIPSQRWDMYVNPELAARMGVKLPDFIMLKSKKFRAK
ncbi:MAG: hypothetical protein M3A44_07560 [Gammaproteobacteria bacterium]